MVKRAVLGAALLFLVHACVTEETDSSDDGGGGGSAGTNASGGSMRGGASPGTGGEGASGGNAGSPDSSGSAGADGGSAGADGGSAGAAVSCPEEKPELGEACGEHRRCFYPNPNEACPSVCAGECGDALYCNQGNWILGEDRIPGCGTPDPDCPADVPEDFVLCPHEGLECRYERTLCQCTPCSGSHGDGGAPPDEQLAWFCTDPGPACPAILPMEGASCEDSEAASCSYGACFDCGPFGWHPASECVDGVWVETHGDCQP